MAGLNLRSLPPDIIWCILRSIDNIPDLENFCIALPNTAGILAERWNNIYDRLYWKEIEEYYFPQLVLLDLIFNGDDVAAEMLQPQGQPRFQYSGRGRARRVKSPLYKKVTSARSRYHSSIRKSLDPETISRMKGMHIQIERMAEIFMKHQLERHHPTPEVYRQPTLEERRKVITAIYNAWAIGLSVFLDAAMKTDPSLRTYKSGSDVAGVYGDLSSSLASTWTFWDVKETRAVFNILWKEIPQNMLKEFSGRPDIEEGCDNVMHFLDFLFSDHEWSPETYLKLFDRQDSEDNTADEETLKYLRQYKAAVTGLSVSPPVGSTSRLLLERLERLERLGIRQCLRRPFLNEFDRKLTSHEPSGGDPDSWSVGRDSYSSPELRRLVWKAPPSFDYLSKFKFAGYENVQTAWSWTTTGNVMADDCVWDDWRLEEWGYQFPQVGV